MLKIFTYAIFCLLFIGCSNKEPKIALKDFPYYDENKANIYFTNKADNASFMQAANGDTRVVNFSYKIVGPKQIVSGTNCYGQYSYIALDEGVYSIQLFGVGFQLFGKREDHRDLEKYFKKGESYFFKIYGSSDNKTTTKQIFSFTGVFSDKDLQLALVEIEKNEALKYLNNGLNFDRHRFSKRAEDNPIDEDCKRWY